MLAAGDLNGDGREDVVMAAGRYRAGELRILYQNAIGGFLDARVVPLTGQPGALAVADVNGDGLKDIVVADWMNGRVFVLAQNAAKGDLDPPTSVEVGKGPISLAVLAPVADGPRLIVVLSTAADALKVLSLAGGSLKALGDVPIGSPPGWGVLSTLARAGKPQVLAAVFAGSASREQLAVFARGEGGGFEPPKGSNPLRTVPIALAALAEGEGAQALAALLGGEEAAVQILTLDEAGAARVAAESKLPPNPRSMCSGDFNGDGIGDLAIAYADRVQMLLGRSLAAEGGPLLPLKAVPIAGGCNDIVAADVGNNGAQDVIVITGAGDLVPILVEP
jgi:hypothetical protein